MESNATNHLDEALDRVSLSFGSVFSEGFNLWKKGLGPLLGFIIISSVISFVVGLIPIAGSIVGNLVLTPALTLGAFIFCHNTLKGRDDFGDFFKGFQIVPSIIILSLITSLVYLLLSVPMILAIGVDEIMGLVTGDLDPTTFMLEDFDWTILLMALPIVLTGFLFSFSLPMMWFYKLSPLVAIKYSCKFVFNNFLTIIALIIVAILFAISGIIGLIIGIFVTIPIIYTVLYSTFSQGTDLHAYLDDTVDLEISDHLVEEA